MYKCVKDTEIAKTTSFLEPSNTKHTDPQSLHDLEYNKTAFSAISFIKVIVCRHLMSLKIS